MYDKTNEPVWNQLLARTSEWRNSFKKPSMYYQNKTQLHKQTHLLSWKRDRKPDKPSGCWRRRFLFSGLPHLTDYAKLDTITRFTVFRVLVRLIHIYQSKSVLTTYFKLDKWNSFDSSAVRFLFREAAFVFSVVVLEPQ